jgi:hypothetical protein
MEHVGKAIKNKPQFKATIRNDKTVICPQGALARYLLQRFHPHGGQEAIPHPLTQEWNNMPLFPESRNGKRV